MKKLLAVLVAAVVMVGPVANAQKAPHGPDRIVGTRHADVLRGGNGPDVIIGKAGDDHIWGNRAPDVIRGGRGNDVLHGFGSGETRDLLRGGRGHDTCIGTRRDVFVSCERIVIRKGLGSR